MTANFTSQEILVVINTKFAAEEYMKNEEEKGKPLSDTERLADACWNGMLTARIPEISIIKNKKPLPILELCEGNEILYLKLGETDEQPAAEYTINPYRFADHMFLN